MKHIIIDMQNLTDDEQIKLWLNLFDFADKELPKMKDLKVIMVP